MKRLAIVGLPNTGKSTFFNRLTGASAKVGNWPGITVELYSARIILGADAVEVVDLPGIYNLHGFSEDEKVARRFLEQTPLHLIAVIVNATQLDRQLGLALQAKELGIPMVLLVNMQDEARRLGIAIDRDRLEAELDTPVVMMSAKHGPGVDEARRVLMERMHGAREARANPAVFAGDDAIIARLDEHGADRRVREEPRPEPGRRYSFALERRGNRLRWFLDGAGNPAISFPVGYTPAGLPLSMHAMGRHWQEHLLLRVAFNAERLVQRHLPRHHWDLLK